MPATLVAVPRVLPLEAIHAIALHFLDADKDRVVRADGLEWPPVELVLLTCVNKAWRAACAPLVWKQVTIRASTIGTHWRSRYRAERICPTSQTTSLLLDLHGLTSTTATHFKADTSGITSNLKELRVELSTEAEFDSDTVRSVIRELSLGFVKHLSLKLSLVGVAHLHLVTNLLNACPRLTSVRLARVDDINGDGDGDGDGGDLLLHKRPACILLYELLRNKLKLESLYTEFPLPCTLSDAPCPWQLTSLGLVTNSFANADTLKEVLLPNIDSLVHLNLECTHPLVEMASSSRRLFAFPHLETLTLSEPTFLACLTNKTSLSHLTVTVKPSTAPELLAFLERHQSGRLRQVTLVSDKSAATLTAQQALPLIVHCARRGVEVEIQ